LKDVSISEHDNYNISIVPNPTENDFYIIFENPIEQVISIELLDILGRTILNIFDDIASEGKQIYPLDVKLLSGTYFVKFIIKEKPVVRKLIVK